MKCPKCNADIFADSGIAEVADARERMAAVLRRLEDK
jgi:hypothetical protein